MTDRKTILIGEDNPLNMKLAADSLEFNGYNALTTEAGETALDDEKEALRCVKVGAYGYLTKPIDVDKIEEDLYFNIFYKKD